MRKQRNIVDYFPHDARAGSGNTLTILQNRFGNNGYAVWFKLLEKLASTDGHFIDCRNKLHWQLLIAQLGSEEITTVEILNLLVEIDAIDKELWGSKVIWCQKLVDNLTDVYKNRRRAIPPKPILTGNNGLITDKNSITTVDIPQSKVEESRVEESRIDNGEVFRVYENEIGQLTPSVSENIQQAEKDYPPQWIPDAIKEAARKNKRSWAYAEGILKRWKSEGRTTLPASSRCSGRTR